MTYKEFDKACRWWGWTLTIGITLPYFLIVFFGNLGVLLSIMCVIIMIGRIVDRYKPKQKKEEVKE